MVERAEIVERGAVTEGVLVLHAQNTSENNFAKQEMSTEPPTDRPLRRETVQHCRQT